MFDEASSFNQPLHAPWYVVEQWDEYEDVKKIRAVVADHAPWYHDEESDSE